MTKLVIVESPAKCKKIESYLGSGYKCIASFGHIRELADGLKGIDVKNNLSHIVFDDNISWENGSQNVIEINGIHQ